MKRKIIALATVISMALSFGVIAVHGDENGAIYNKTWDAYYDTLEEALDDSDPGDEIYISDRYYQLEKSLTIPEDVTVIVPTSSSYNDCITGNNAHTDYTAPSTTYKLEIPEGKTLTVDGTLLVAGNQFSGPPKAGCQTGDRGEIVLDSNSSIIVNGALYARGLISGSGTVIANSDSTVYQLFQIQDWRGGTGSYFAYSWYNIFPFNRYEFSNIQSNATYYNGSAMIGQFYIYADNTDCLGETVIFGANGMLGFSNTATSSNYITTSYNNDKLNATINGPVETGDMVVTIQISGNSYSIDSSTTVLPFGYKINVNVPSQNSLKVTNKIKLLPGCDMSIGGTLTIDANKALYVYGQGGYSTNYNYGGWANMPTEATLNVSAATLNNNGTIATSSVTGSNLTGLSVTDTSNTDTVYEFVQNTFSKTPVTFYKAA